MQVIVSGSRDWADIDAVFRALDELQPTLVIQGGARGADLIAKNWCEARGVRCKTYPAAWARHGRRAGMLRNVLMLQSHPTALVVAFPLDGPGTWGCIREARARRMAVRVYGVDGLRENV